MKNRLGAGALFGEPPPTGVAHARGAIAEGAVANKIDVDVVPIGGPVPLAVVEKSRPVRQKMMSLEVPQRERETMIDAYQRGRVFLQSLHQPFGNPTARPEFARSERWQNFGGWCVTLGEIDAQTLQPRGGSFRARIVDADLSLKCGQVAALKIIKYAGESR